MKKIGLFILGLCSLFCVGNLTRANDYEYTNLDITANILSDGTIDVNEDFTANFFVNKHGIIRDIPLNYSIDGKNFHIEVSNINVQGKNFTTSNNNGNIEIKIGDGDRTVIGEQSYPISYSAYGLIRNFSGMGYAELYWNLVGYTFDNNINKVRAELILPKIYTGFTKDDFLITTDGTAKTIDGFEGSVDWNQGDRIIITYDKGLSPYQGITLAIKLPNNYFTFDHERQANLRGHISGYNIINSFYELLRFLLILGGIIGFIAIILLIIHRFGKTIKNYWKGIIATINDFRRMVKNYWKSTKIYMHTNLNKGKLEGKHAKQFPIIIQYNPPEGLNSAEVGLLLHRKAQPKDLLSLIYKRAYENHIKIRYSTDGSIVISKLDSIPRHLPMYEQGFFNNLLRKPTRIIEKNSNLYQVLNLNELDAYGIEKGWLNNIKDDNIKFFEKLKNIIGCVGGFVFLLSFFLIILSFIINDKYTETNFLRIGLYGFLLTGLVRLFLGIISFTFLPYAKSKKYKETDKGAEIISHILGYREFLAKCDENKLRLFLQQDPFYFDKILPYAIVFGLETELIKKIMPIMNEMDISSNIYSGDLLILSETFSDISSSLHSYSTSSSYDSDSGRDSGSSFDSGGSSFSSGGGGGGGGGSSW